MYLLAGELSKCATTSTFVPFGSRFGVEAVDAISEGDYGKMVALRGTRIERVPLAEAIAEPKLVDAELYETAEVFFG